MPKQNNETENSFWIAMAHLSHWKVEVINQLLVKILLEDKISLSDFISLDNMRFKERYLLDEKQIADLNQIRVNTELYQNIAKEITKNHFSLVPINSKIFSRTLKENLNLKHCPPLLYTIGNQQILNEESVAIVGSRDAGEKSLEFTDKIAKKMTQEYKVVVSGFAKGVDQRALDSALEVYGHSIIVLPQGILTFSSGIKKYSAHIENGNLLVVSTFPPKAGWSVGLAMARNVYIYGLAKEIYVAQTSNSGGTWTGAIDGIKKKRSVYVRYPEKGEKNANLELIEKGAIPVDFEGRILNNIVLSPQKESEDIALFKEL